MVISIQLLPFLTSCFHVLPSPCSVCMFTACHSGSIFPCLAIQRNCHSWMSAQPLSLALLWARGWPSWTPTVPSNIKTWNIPWFSILLIFGPRVRKERVSDWTNNHLDNFKLLPQYFSERKRSFLILSPYYTILNIYFFVYESYLKVNASRKDGDMLFDFSLPDVFLEIK